MVRNPTDVCALGRVSSSYGHTGIGTQDSVSSDPQYQYYTNIMILGHKLFEPNACMTVIFEYVYGVNQHKIAHATYCYRPSIISGNERLTGLQFWAVQ